MAWDDDDWVGEPPEGRHSRDRARPEFWRRQRYIALGAAALIIAVAVVAIVLAIKG